MVRASPHCLFCERLWSGVELLEFNFCVLSLVLGRNRTAAGKWSTVPSPPNSEASLPSVRLLPIPAVSVLQTALSRAVGTASETNQVSRPSPRWQPLSGSSALNSREFTVWGAHGTCVGSDPPQSGLCSGMKVHECNGHVYTSLTLQINWGFLTMDSTRKAVLMTPRDSQISTRPIVGAWSVATSKRILQTSLKFCRMQGGPRG